MARGSGITRTTTGSRWELAAESFLQKRGLSTLSRNFRCRLGELDLVMSHGDQLVFVEVRYRRNPVWGSGAETVNQVKQQRLARAAAMYLARNPKHAARICRFDVLSIREDDGKPKFTWIRNAFETTQG